MTLRKKDNDLARDCGSLSAAAADARAWAEDNVEQLGVRQEALSRTLQKQTVEARKLARAAARPMSIGIFGPSQHGKSFLSGGFLRPRDVEEGHAFGRVRFGSGDDTVSLNFTSEINPQGQRETTGLVTRFTLRDFDVPDGYPVQLRIMSEVEAIKILANSFVFDLNCDAVNDIDEEHLRALFDAHETGIGASGKDDPFAPEDVFELADYFQKAFRNRRHPIGGAVGDYYWDRAAALLPRLTPPQRAKVLAPLWGEAPEFTEVYLELKSAIDALGNEEIVFAPLDAIRDRTQGKTILHVLTMKNGLVDQSGELLPLVSRGGCHASLRRPIVAAVALEMTLRIEEAPWSFFETTDLLDFPGCRKREDKNRHSMFVATEETHPIGEAFLRGKVAVMFDSYAEDFDINFLIACHKCEQSSSNFPELVEDWVYRSHGVTPEERAGKPVCLFFAVTWSDLLLDESVGADRELKFDNALSIFEKMSGFANWSGSDAFDNAFLLRSIDGKKFSEFFEIEDIAPPSGTEIAPWREVQLRPEKVASKDAYRDAFASSAKGRRYFAEPALKWDAMMTPNDGGLTLLARELEARADPDIKHVLLARTRDTVISALNTTLAPYYESGDIATRMQERLATIREAIEVLKKRKDLVPRFAFEFQPGAEMLRTLYVECRRAHVGGSTVSQYSTDNVGEAVMQRWTRMMAQQSANEALAEAYGLDGRLFKRVGDEIERGAILADMPGTINQRVSEIEEFSQDSTRNADQVSLTLSVMIGDFVSYLGCSGAIRLPACPETPLFANRIAMDGNGLPVFAEKRRDMQDVRSGFMTDWLEALEFMTETNARSSEGGLVDVEQNARLGSILDRIKVA